MFLQDAAHCQDILLTSDEGSRQDVVSHLNAEQDILPVHLADIGHGQNRPWHVDPLVVGDKTAIHHMADNLLPLNLFHRHLNQPVINENRSPHFDVILQVLIGNGRFLGCPQDFLCRQHKALPADQFRPSPLKVPQADFRPLGIQHGRHRKPHFLPGLQHPLKLFPLLLMGAVGKIEPRHVHARQHQLPQTLHAFAGRTYGTDDLCPSHSIDLTFPIRFFIFYFNDYIPSSAFGLCSVYPPYAGE